MTEDLDRAIEDAVKEALERDRAQQDQLRRERDTAPVESETSDAARPSEASSDDAVERDDAAGDAACPGGEATTPDR